MEEKNSLISIIVRTKDRPKLLKRAIESIGNQTYRPIEVVIVNDGGCDLDVEELRRILADIPLNYIRLEKNTGRAYAGNVGIEHATGDYIGFLDDDDEFYPEHVSTLIDLLERTDYRVAYTDSEIVRYYFDKGVDEFLVEDRYVLFSEDFSYEKLLLGNYIPLTCLLFDSSLLRDLNFDESFDLYEDWDLLIRVAQKAPFYHITKVTAKYNQNLGQQITANFDFRRPAFEALVEKHMHEINPQVLFYGWQMIIESRELITGIGEPKLTIKNLRYALREKDAVIEESAKIIEENAKIIGENAKIIEENANLICRLYDETNQLQHTINTIKNTLGWQMLESSRNFRDRILSNGSKRRYFFELIIKSMKVIKTQGFSVFLYKVAQKMKISRNIHISKTEKSGIYILNPLVKEPVDIIVPVHNAYEDVKGCIRSVLDNTDMNCHRIVIIDDKSDDQRIRDYLETLKYELNGIKAVFIFNEANLGFAKTANMGMRFSDRDVILLNTDTIVTDLWVEKLRRAAYSSPGIATVTPFSNNATICSIPNFCESNPLPERFDVHSFAEFIDKISMRYYPEIPTGVGFCMFIKREILNEVGFFDESSFDKGYGEENDFCMRALKKGYTHVLDDSTFIYHKGGASFTREVKMIKELEALKILEKMHPEYLPIVNKFIRENPLKHIHHYIKLRINLEKKKELTEYQATNN
jgi:GT2 family glycosyltransferase